ncbi:unnamed protein product [Sphenostylis stenocarpa]|uniref:Uncharacterized protein n=1 Tax=Sphenostylis stenocarpa TaxID=92480 RepID=A0AA86S986_9FABA|nr:unnamed protein product [Sphenostylis stenocarpa]
MEIDTQRGVFKSIIDEKLPWKFLNEEVWDVNKSEVELSMRGTQLTGEVGWVLKWERKTWGNGLRCKASHKRQKVCKAT